MRKDGADPWGVCTVFYFENSEIRFCNTYLCVYFRIELFGHISNIYILELSGINSIIRLKRCAG